MISGTTIITPLSVTVRAGGAAVTLQKDSYLGRRLIALIRDEADKTDEAIALLKNPAPEVEWASGDQRFKILSDHTVLFNGERLPEILQNRMYELWTAGYDISFMTNFVNRLWANPSNRAREELFRFLAHKNMPITADGCFLAYKATKEDGYSVTANLTTKVLKGIVDSQGRIYNPVGAEIVVERGHVDDNCNNYCSHGLHVGSREYAEGFGPRVVVVKVDPKDVVSVPLDCNGQKLRTCRYVILSDYKGPLKTAAVLDDQRPYESDTEDDEEDDILDPLIARVEDLLEELDSLRARR